MLNYLENAENYRDFRLYPQFANFPNLADLKVHVGGFNLKAN